MAYQPGGNVPGGGWMVRHIDQRRRPLPRTIGSIVFSQQGMLARFVGRGQEPKFTQLAGISASTTGSASR